MLLEFVFTPVQKKEGKIRDQNKEKYY